MTRIPLDELKRRCQKIEPARLGNWMARRISRPMALRVTWVLAPWGVSANAVTLAAWTAGLAAAGALTWGTDWSWLAAALLLQISYLLDHVDGQLARLHGTASLDGVQLDYLMHHTLNLAVPLGAGFGLSRATGEETWLAAGAIWGMASLLITLHHDARYKAFIQRLKCVRGRLEVIGGGGGRPQPQPPIPRSPLRLAGWTARKACEGHVVMNLLALLAIAQLPLAENRLPLGQVYVGSMAAISTVVAAWTLARSLRSRTAEREWAAWYRAPQGCELVFRDGWWFVEPDSLAAPRDAGTAPSEASKRPS